MKTFRDILKMNSYLKETKKLLSEERKPLMVVIGNESVDLDSAVSSLSLAYHLNKVKCKSKIISNENKLENFFVLPIINAKKVELPIKTEVTHWIIKNNIELSNLICRDEINLDDVDKFILVDHHVSVFRDKVISVLDHRPFDKNSSLASNCFFKIQEVGSCASLVTEVIKNDANEDLSDYSEALQLCYGAIVLDTINFSKEADKVRQLDYDMGEYIEKALNVKNVSEHRKSLYDELVAARADVSSLDSYQILYKDLKIISNEDGNVKVAFPGVHVFKYVKMENAAENVRKFAEDEKIDVVFMMGMAPKAESIERFLGVINIKNSSLFTAILNAINEMKDPNLQLTPKDVDFMSGLFYMQENIKASRKQILPVIKNLLNRF